MLDLGGQLVVLVDMAGLRVALGKAEAEGIRRAEAEIAQADLVLWLAAPDVKDTAPVATAAPVWRIASKADLEPNAGSLAVSAVNGEGIDALLARLAEAAIGGGAPPLLSRERDRQAIMEARAALAGVDLRQEELAAEHLRAANLALARLIGAVDAEAVLDRLFLSFCIGK
jgi:tRNA modification GTPase